MNQDQQQHQQEPQRRRRRSDSSFCGLPDSLNVIDVNDNSSDDDDHYNYNDDYKKNSFNQVDDDSNNKKEEDVSAPTTTTTVPPPSIQQTTTPSGISNTTITTARNENNNNLDATAASTSSSLPPHKRKPVLVIWDIENCSVSDSKCIPLILALKSIANCFGFISSFYAIGDSHLFEGSVTSKMDCCGVKFHHIPQMNKETADKAILVTLLDFVLEHKKAEEQPVVCLISSDSDFCSALYVLKRHHIEVVVISKYSLPNSQLLRSCADDDSHSFDFEQIYKTCTSSSTDHNTAAGAAPSSLTTSNSSGGVGGAGITGTAAAAATTTTTAYVPATYATSYSSGKGGKGGPSTKDNKPSSSNNKQAYKKTNKKKQKGQPNLQKQQSKKKAKLPHQKHTTTAAGGGGASAATELQLPLPPLPSTLSSFPLSSSVASLPAPPPYGGAPLVAIGSGSGSGSGGNDAAVMAAQGGKKGRAFVLSGDSSEGGKGNYFHTHSRSHHAPPSRKEHYSGRRHHVAQKAAAHPSKQKKNKNAGDESQQQQQQQQQTAWEEFVELSDGIPIALKWVLIALQTKGIFDPYASHVLLHNMNEMRASIDDPNKLDLWKDIQFEALLPFVPEQKTKIADTFLTKMLNQVSRCRIGTYKYKQYLAHMLSQKQTEVTDALDDLEKDIITCLAFNHRASLDMAERLLISLQGHVNSVAREFAVRMLNVVYDFHDWQIERALPVQVVRIGDPFKVQLSLAGEDVKPESVLIQTVTPSTLPSSRNTIWMHHKPVVSGSTVTFDFNHFTRAGFYDYRFVVVMEDGSVEPVRIKGKPAQGRFIAQSKVNEERIHEVWVDVHQARWNPTTRDIVQRGSFEGIASSIDEYAKTGISTLYVMGALERNDFYPFAPTDRRSPQKSAGGSSGFNQLVHKAHERGIKVIVDSTPWLAPRPHRRYRNVLCSSVDAYGRVVPQFAIDSNYEEKTHCAMVNYRKKEAWDLLVNDVASWAREHNIDGILLEGAASLPFILEPDLAELLRRDSDNHLHYPHQDIIDGEVVVPTRKSSRVLGYWGTRASSEYPNPLFVKLARKLWERHPTFQIFGDITPIKDRESSVIISGLIPYTQQLTNLLEQGILEHSKAIAEHEKRRSARSIMSAWYDKYPQGKLPDGSLIVVPSSSHIIPYPTMRIGMGTFAHISFLLAAPETPVTYVGELDASRFSIDIMTGKLRVEKEALNKNQAERLKEHYLYRAALRKKHHLLRTGKLRMLRAKANGVEVDSVAAFVRYSAKEKELLICAVNFSSQETSFAVDLSELVDIPELELSTDDTKNPNFQLNDLLNPQNPRQHYSSFEFLNEPHFVTLYAYASMIWKAVKLPTDIASQRNILSDSISRLQSIFHAGSDPTYNHFYRTIVHALRSYETFKELLNSLAYVVPQNSDLDHKLPYIIQETIYHCTRPGAKNSYEETSIYGLLVRLNTDMYPAWPGQDLARRVLLANNIGPLVFVTPEIAPWSTIGGVAIMLDELTQDLAQLGLEIIVISPYYNFNRDGKTDYLRSEGVEHILNYDVYVAGEKCSIGLHSLKKNHVQYYFMHNYTYFPSPYHTGAPDHQLKMVVLMAKATLELMCQLRILPAVVITNDWFTALTPGYARCGDFGQTFQNATFFHLIHNLEEGYQGLIWPDSNDMFRGIHGLPEHLVVDYLGAPTVINTSRCALQTVNQWGTVSASYRDDLMRGSPFAHLLRQYPNPFAYSNGIRVGHRLKTLAKVAKSHEEAKAILQKTYFGYSDPSIPVFSFVGRITVQKGVQLILESVKTLIDAFNGKIQILVGGMANKKEKYAAHCAWQMHSLRHTYPNNFWADPEAYFTTGALVNLGSDFGLMPSLFEPSGVVQQEYFVAGTPVIAFSTGGLKDTVFEFYEGKGNGFVFMAHQHADFVYAVKRAVACFNNPEQYAKLRENARASVLDTATVAEAWGKEFFRLRKRLWLGEHFVRPKEDFEDEDGDKNAKAALAALSSAPPPPSTSTTTTTTEAK